jgi:hypothetical protein
MGILIVLIIIAGLVAGNVTSSYRFNIEPSQDVHELDWNKQSYRYIPLADNNFVYRSSSVILAFLALGLIAGAFVLGRDLIINPSDKKDTNNE